MVSPHAFYLNRHASLLPVFIAFGLGVAILLRREIGTAVLLVGILANEAFNDVLKTAIAEPRPQRASERGVWGEYGMPSSHAQFMGFFVAYMTLWTLRRLRPRPTPLCGPVLTEVVKWLVILALIAAAALVVWSRVYLKYHTVEQVACGIAVGAAAGTVWYVDQTSACRRVARITTNHRIIEGLHNAFVLLCAISVCSACVLAMLV